MKKREGNVIYFNRFNNVKQIAGKLGDLIEKLVEPSGENRAKG
jgi:hypothetical protein